jgi:undecaprenyl-diphosphatase
LSRQPKPYGQPGEYAPGVDYRLFKAINGLSGNSFADSVVKFFATDMVVVLVGLVALTFLVPWTRNRWERRNGAVLATASAGLALLISQPIGHLVDRTRPFLAHPSHAHLLISQSHDPSFPSDHASGAFALAFGIWLYDRTFGTVFLIMAAIVAFARVYVGTHYPGDVVGGAALGIAAASGLYFLPPTRRLLEAVARRCGETWDRVVGRLSRSRTA